MVFDVSHIHELLDQAETEYHTLFAGHVPSQAERFGPHVDTVRMVIDESALSATKEDEGAA